MIGLKTKHKLNIAAVAALICTTVMSAANLDAKSYGVVNVDFNEKPLGTPTLDYLHEQGALIPEKLPEQVVYPNSGYKLTEVSEQEAAGNPEYLIRYDVSETNELIPHYFKLELKEHDYGHKDTATREIYYKWERDGNKMHLVKSNDGTGNVVYYVDDNQAHSSRLNFDRNIPSGFEGNVEGDFVELSYNNTFGAGIYVNSVEIGNVDSDFVSIRNNRPGTGIYVGEANGKIGDITGSFINNIASGGNGGAAISIQGGGQIGDIKGDFIGNECTNGAGAWGGAISLLNGKTGFITGNFIANHATATGGAIHIAHSNQYEVSVEGIAGGFLYNYAKNIGGAIHNTGGRIDSLVGDFVINSTDGNGGAIANTSDSPAATSVKLGIVVGDFIRNSAGQNGGAIFNVASRNDGLVSVDALNGRFVNNKAAAGNGGAIFNEASGRNASVSIENMKSKFANNNAANFGGAIYNNATNGSAIIGDMEGLFINNEAGTSGGAIYNASSNDASAKITSINADFFSNKASLAYGGAIYNSKASVDKINGDFVNNASGMAGGAIYNGASSVIASLSGNFAGNSSQDYGGAIANTDAGSEITKLENAVFQDNTSANGGAIYSYDGTIGTISGGFKNNQAIGDRGMGGAISNSSNSVIKSISSDFIENTASLYGGAIYNRNIINEFVESSFEGNKATRYGGAIHNAGTIDKVVKTTFKGNTSEQYGGAICNLGTVGEFVNTSFIDNHAKSFGGAIFTQSDLNITADNDVSVFKGNTTGSGDSQSKEAIFVNSEVGNVNFNLKNGGSVLFEDKIYGPVGYKVNINGDDINKTAFYMLNDFENASLNVQNTTLNTVNNETHNYEFNNFTLSGDVNFVGDIDFAKGEVDRISAKTYGEHSGNLNVTDLNIISDLPQGQDMKDIMFAQQGLKDKVQYLPGNNSDGFYSWMTPIYKYGVKYENRDDAGYFTVARGGAYNNWIGSNNPSTAFNPSILASPVAMQAGTYAAQNAAFTQAFQHSDIYMMNPAMNRLGQVKANRYAINPEQNSGLAPVDNSAGIWARPYATFENVALHYGPKVNVINYGTIVGGDSGFKELRHGWTTVTTAYAGYNGSSQSYSGVSTYQNGGLIGAAQTWYKKNFFTALTATAGATVGEASTMYGHESFTSLMAGIASKTGYNLEFKEGKYIIQPSMRLAYSFINTFDYTNAAGVRMDSDPMHAIQINPNIRFVSNLSHGWTPYASVGMVWNIIDDTKFMANNVMLPQMSIKPYIEYGVGLQKQCKDNFTAWGQAMVRNGGRNGIALTLGFKWMLGKDGEPIQNVKTQPSAGDKTAVNTPERKVVKQLSPSQKAGIMSTTRTSKTSVLKMI